MRMIMWLLTILFALAGLALRDDRGFGGFGLALLPPYLAPYIWKGCFILAFLACPFLWAPSGLLPGLLRGKTRFMMALALILATPLILPWPF